MRDNKIREIMVATVAKRRAEIERLRADNERLHNEDTKTRHALKGWVYVPPDGGAEPTHERVAAVVAEVERLREALEVEGLRLAACDVVAMADTPESAGRARQMQSDFRSAALSSVERRVDEVIALRAENERLRDVLRRVSVHPSGDRMVKIAFVSEGCTVTSPVRPQTTWALEVMIEFDKVRREALEVKP